MRKNTMVAVIWAIVTTVASPGITAEVDQLPRVVVDAIIARQLNLPEFPDPHLAAQTKVDQEGKIERQDQVAYDQLFEPIPRPTDLPSVVEDF